MQVSETAQPAPDRGASASVLLRADKENVALLTLHRPEARNALSDALIDALSRELDAIAADRSIRAVIVASAPSSCFSSGHDLKEISARRSDPDRGRAYFEDLLGRCAAMMQKIVRLPQPVIAAVESLATAAGCQLVASCDLAVAGEDARFCTPGVHIGLFCSTPMVALSRNVAPKHAMEMLLTGETIAAADALRMGLVNRVVPAGHAVDAARRLAAVIASKSAPVLAVGKRAFYEQIEMGLEDAYAHASRVMAENMLARDAEEGIGAFLEKRTPRWE
ncbi:enoyl-CoA hydratase [Alsobacter metallidurans]|uniref:Enoyl-CoA hydratase domain-containing protein 3, mitochondrial n=1 Tax=Alsobacter metallidurans TaxID=340221 RepID=A0A917I7S2_9HYPH|nr:enoyl-CoA hydratase [Alsobacter metallidurans]GGH21366.1 enoyl-CoA hydratase [Alsobacter metallidurans]